MARRVGALGVAEVSNFCLPEPVYCGSMSVIVFEAVTKRFRRTVALNNLDFEVSGGRLTALLGPNGAGKTTAFRSIMGLCRPDSGKISVMDHKVGPDTGRIVKDIGWVSESGQGLFDKLTAVDNLKVAAAALGRGSEQIGDLLELVGLGDVPRKHVKGFSKGMKQRLALAAGLLGDPPILLLDEPLDGLDPAGQAELKRIMRRLVEEEGRTIFLSSHDLADVEELADDVVLINQGRLVTMGRMETLLDDRSDEFEVVVSDAREAAAILSRGNLAAQPKSLDLVLVKTDSGAKIARMLTEAGIYPEEIRKKRSHLEEVFLSLTEGEGSL